MVHNTRSILILDEIWSLTSRKGMNIRRPLVLGKKTCHREKLNSGWLSVLQDTPCWIKFVPNQFVKRWTNSQNTVLCTTWFPCSQVWSSMTCQAAMRRRAKATRPYWSTWFRKLEMECGSQFILWFNTIQCPSVLHIPWSPAFQNFWRLPVWAVKCEPQRLHVRTAASHCADHI